MNRAAASPPLERLAAPPIVEVACGVVFEPLRELDPVAAGLFWGRVRDEYPERALLPAITNETRTITIGALPPMRTMLLSRSGEQLIQLQSDRFNYNWRAIGSVYPRFSSNEGVGAQAQARFEQLCAFLDETFGCHPEPSHVEVVKVDLLRSDEHWQGLPDLSQLLPPLAPLLSGRSLSAPNLSVQLQDEWAGCVTHVRVQSHPLPDATAIRLETAARAPVGAEGLAHAFARANEAVNQAFAWLIPKSERERRFQEERS